MTKKSNKPKILLDADVIIHFTKAKQQFLLPKIFPEQFVILDKVKHELEQHKDKNKTQAIYNFIEWSKISVIPMPTNIEIIKEYALLRRTLGDGEAACLAVARYTKDFVASSNLKDIKLYCETHEIVYLTTMDILLQAYHLEIMDEETCDNFIRDVKESGSKLIKDIDSIKIYQASKNQKAK